MFEIEVKFPHGDLHAIRARLIERGARWIEVREDADQYFNAPDRDFARTDEAFRIRRIGSKNLLTYKGPKIDSQTKTRLEIEVPVVEGGAVAANLQRLVEALGYQPVAIVRKHREIFESIRDGFAIHYCLDLVDHVGSYVEIEIVAEERHLDAARSMLAREADELGLKQSERRSYLHMLLEKRKPSAGDS